MWKCNHVQNYWKLIFRVLSDISTQNTPPAPEWAILNLYIDAVPQHVRHVTTHILLAARLPIKRLWKTEKAPSMEQTLELVNLHYSYEIAMASSGGYLAKSKKAWLPGEIWSGAVKCL